jgi:hypothetical protein
MAMLRLCLSARNITVMQSQFLSSVVAAFCWDGRAGRADDER